MTTTVRVPLLVQDLQQVRADRKESSGPKILLATPVEWHNVRHEGQHYDGPVSARVAVLDFDAESGSLRPGAEFLPQGIGRTVSSYDVDKSAADPDETSVKALESDAFIQVNTYATVMKTIHFFERPDMLGRSISWDFDSPQLLIIPRAGIDKNAYYDRDSASLQFFYYPSSSGYTIYTCLSRDVVAHETAHAVLDGISPGLYDAASAQSLALHEAVADLVAVSLGILDEMIVFSLHQLSGGNLNVLDNLSWFAEEFGADVRRDVGADFLRAVGNDRTLDPSDSSVDKYGTPNYVGDCGPHTMSGVMSGAVYRVFERATTNRRVRDEPLHSRKERAVLAAGRCVISMAIRALDYLPPGEASFADYGRAIIAADRAAFSKVRTEQVWLKDELLRRKVVKDERELAVDDEFVGKKLHGVNPRKILADRRAAREFVQRHRKLLRIPAGVKYQVQPRRRRIRRPTRKKSEKPKRDLIVRVSWNITEKHNLGPRFGRDWAITVGTTLVIDWDSKEILSVLSTEQGEERWADRDRQLRRWAKAGLLRPEADAIGTYGQLRTRSLIARDVGGAMHVAGCGQVLHILEDPK